MSRTAIICGMALVFGSASACAAGVPAEYVGKLSSLSKDLRQFEARFRVVERYTPPPAAFSSVEKEKHLLEAAARAPKLGLGKQEQKQWLEIQRRMWEADFRKRRTPTVNRYSGELLVNGEMIRWTDRSGTLAFDGKKMVLVNRSEPNAGTGLSSGKDWINVKPSFSLPLSQRLPFYGALHPAMPMFPLKELDAATPAASAGYWKLHPTNRYGSAKNALVKFDEAGRVAEMRVFLGEKSTADSDILERWSFAKWQTRSGVEFPSRIEAEFYQPQPLGVPPPFSTARTRAVSMELAEFKLAAPAFKEFDLQHVAAGSLVQDDRYQPSLTYSYQGSSLQPSLDQLSEYFHKHPGEADHSGGPQVGETRKQYSVFLFGLLVVLLVLLWRRRSAMLQADAVQKSTSG